MPGREPEEEQVIEAPVTAEPAVAAPAAPSAIQSWQSAMGNAALARLLSPEDRVRGQVAADTGFDLSEANIRQASPVADAQGVPAITHGRDVHVASATPGPETARGRDVLAHELTHVVQQATGSLGPASEREAEYTATRSRQAPAAPARSLRPLPVSTLAIPMAYDPRYHRRALVHALAPTGFSDEDIGRIYQANWERDMSQAHPALANVALRWKEFKLAASKGKTPLQPLVDAFNASVRLCLEPDIIKNIATSEAYGGYRYYEHMDNPGKEAAFDPTADISEQKKQERQRTLAALRAIPPGESVPQYMVDSREYMKAQLIRAAEDYRGMTFDATGRVGGTRDAWERRRAQLEADVPHDVPVATLPGGQEHASGVIADETAQQAGEFRAKPGSSYDGERVAPPVPDPSGAANGNGASPGGGGAGAAAGAPAPPAQDLKPVQGPKFIEEVDAIFYRAHPEMSGQRLDPGNPDHAQMIQEWLGMRDQVRARNTAENRRVAEAAAAARAAQAGGQGAGEQGSTPAAKPLSRNAADGLGRASHALEDFWSHSNFVELGLGMKLSEINPAAEGSPSTNIDTELQTSTFGGLDQKHSIAHKVRAVADEIESERALIERATGRNPNDADARVNQVGSEAAPREDHHEGGIVDDAIELLSDGALWDLLIKVGGDTIGGAAGGALSEGMASHASGDDWDVVLQRALAGGKLGGIAGFQRGVFEGARDILATTEGVAMLRKLAELLEDVTRTFQDEGSHTQIAKDQPGHHHGDPLNDLRTFRFDVSQELAVKADQEIIGGMRKALDASDAQVEAEMTKLFEQLDKLIGPPAGHPYAGLLAAHKPKADELMADYLTHKAEGHDEHAGHDH